MDCFLRLVVFHVYLPKTLKFKNSKVFGIILKSEEMWVSNVLKTGVRLGKINV